MANIYDMNAAIEKPNVLGALHQGIQFGQQQRALHEQRADQQQLRQLAPQIMAGDPNAYGQAAAINPEAAQGYQSAGDTQLRRMKGAIDYIEQAKKQGNPQAVEAAYQQVRPYLERITGKQAPATFAESEPGFEQAKAQIAMLGPDTNMPTGFRELDMKARAAGLAPGSPEYQEAINIALGRQGRAATGGFGFEKIVGADGRERLARKNPRTGVVEIYDESTGDFSPMGSGSMLNGGSPSTTGAAPPAGRMPNDQIIAFANQMTHAGVPADQVEAWMRNQQSQLQFVSNGAMPSPAGNPALGVSQTPEQRKYAEESGQQAAQLETLRQRGQIEAQNAADLAAAKSKAENAADRSKSAIAKTPQLQNVERGLDRIDAALSALEKGVIGDTGPLDQYYQQFTPQGQELNAAVGAIQNDMLALTRVPGIGSQSDLEAKIANMKYPALSNDPAVNRRNAQQLRAFIGDLAKSLGHSPRGKYSVGQTIEVGGKRYRVTGGDPNDPDVEEVP